MPVMRQHQSDGDKGTDEFLLREYEQSSPIKQKERLKYMYERYAN
jgi:hypothetical protein